MLDRPTANRLGRSGATMPIVAMRLGIIPFSQAFHHRRAGFIPHPRAFRRVVYQFHEMVSASPFATPPRIGMEATP
jgi:hypothetical protein